MATISIKLTNNEQAELLAGLEPSQAVDTDPVIAAHHDLLAGARDREAAPWDLDEPRGEIERRERHERRQRQYIARVEAAWANPKRRAAQYRYLVKRSTLPAQASNLFALLTEEWGGALENCFPGRTAILAAIRGQRRLRTPREDGYVYGMRRLAELLHLGKCTGWCIPRPLTREEDGELIEAASEGRFISAIGRQFNIPANVLAPGHPGLPGPRVWTKRKWAGR